MRRAWQQTAPASAPAKDLGALYANALSKPHDVFAWTSLAYHCAKAGHLEQAFGHWNEAITLNPDNDDFRYQCAKFLFLHGYDEEAAKAMELIALRLRHSGRRIEKIADKHERKTIVACLALLAAATQDNPVLKRMFDRHMIPHRTYLVMCEIVEGLHGDKTRREAVQRKEESMGHSSAAYGRPPHAWDSDPGRRLT